MIFNEKIFSKDECEKIIDYAKHSFTVIEKTVDLKSSRQKILENNRMVGGKNTSYFIYQIPNTKETRWIVEKLFIWFTDKTGIQLHTKKYEKFPDHFMVLQYTQGDRFEKHIDISKGFEYRRWNLGIQLNDDYTGGEYVCWDKRDNEIEMSREAGTAILYHCAVPHEIKEITSGERWSLVIALPKNFLDKKDSFI